jgi:hypothetical protein
MRPSFSCTGRTSPLDLLRAPGHLAGGALPLGPALVLQALGERVTHLGEGVDRNRLQLIAQPLALL